MGITRKTSDYLASVIESIDSMSRIVTGNRLDAIAQYDMIEVITELEQATTTFIYKSVFDIEFPSMAKAYAITLIEINEELMSEIKKVQLKDGYNFDELTTVLKLEAEHLRESTRLS